MAAAESMESFGPIKKPIGLRWAAALLKRTLV